MRRKGAVLFVVIVLVFLSAQAFAGNFVSSSQVELKALLAPFPPDKSPQAQAEIAELVRIQKARTPQELEQAKADKDMTVFRFGSLVLGPKFVKDSLPVTSSLFNKLEEDLGSIMRSAKEAFNRKRPYDVSNEVKSCFGDMGSGSYPSGHTMYAYVCAVILSNMVPEKKAELFERAAQYGRSREVCGVHYPSDVEGGKIAGTVVAAFAMQNPSFQKQFGEAKNELRKALGL